ncbi:MAG: peptide chain release factor N(5)-glutamine methyltransferase [Epsilonproteobacteria bacterium]|nr:MAG: peptide chain release factor N(5)-glutamine methyltransferase [Campylobacterota bacterium]RLA65955.1 MAG: peptide chain release factor N(5)-glutamine methyltransferase [Campylobacterota bacterium]
MAVIDQSITDFFNEKKQELEAWYPGIKLSRLKLELLEFANEDNLEIIFQKLQAGVPLQYITGKAAFYHHEFEVTSDTLIPRSETETLVELTLVELKKIEKLPEVLDIGTGTGAIIISLLGEAPLNGMATDISEKALEVAKRNYLNLKPSLKDGSIEFRNTDRLEGIDKKFHLIVSNPPYIKKEGDKDLVHHQVKKYEPSQALFLNDEDYKNWFEVLFKDSLAHLLENGVFLMEGHENHLDDLKELSEKIGFERVEILKDLSNRKRYLKAYGQTSN